MAKHKGAEIVQDLIKIVKDSDVSFHLFIVVNTLQSYHLLSLSYKHLNHLLLFHTLTDHSLNNGGKINEICRSCCIIQSR